MNFITRYNQNPEKVKAEIVESLRNCSLSFNNIYQIKVLPRKEFTQVYKNESGMEYADVLAPPTLAFLSPHEEIIYCDKTAFSRKILIHELAETSNESKRLFALQEQRWKILSKEYEKFRPEFSKLDTKSQFKFVHSLLTPKNLKYFVGEVIPSLSEMYVTGRFSIGMRKRKSQVSLERFVYWLNREPDIILGQFTSEVYILGAGHFFEYDTSTFAHWNAPLMFLPICTRSPTNLGVLAESISERIEDYDNLLDVACDIFTELSGKEADYSLLLKRLYDSWRGIFIDKKTLIKICQ